MTMKNYISILLFFVFGILNAQQVKEEKITISYKDLSKIEVIKEIENKSNHYFYFVESWLDDGKLVSGDYNNVSVNVILEDLFKDTLISYFMYSYNKIILTLNSGIHDSFPNLTEWESKVNADLEEPSTPIFYNENFKKNSEKSSVVRIGKESKNATKKSYLLTGYARNILSGEPIPSLTIVVKNKNISAITDEKGFYSIQIPTGANSVEAKSLGYSDLKKTIIIYNNGVYNFLLTESSELLDELVIEADKDKNIKEAVTGVTSIKIQDIKNIPLVLGERDILKVATAIPGIKTAGEGSAGFNVRGGKADQNLILLDDAVLYNPQHFFGIFSAINPFTVGDVDIYKGSIPSEFGGRLSSVFNIKTKEGDFEKITGEASIGPVTSSATVQMPIVKGKSSLIFGGRGTYSNWILRSLKDKSLSRSSISFYDFNLKYTHKISKNDKFEATGYYSNDSFSITSDSLQSYTNRLVSLKWRHQFNDKNYGDLILANSDYKFNIEFDQNSINDFDLDYRINETELKLKMKYLASEKHKIDYGASTKLFNISPGNIDPKGNQSVVVPLEVTDERGLESAIFIADNFEVSKKLLFNIGFRYSFFSALGASVQNIYDPNQPRSENSIIDTQTFNKNEVIKTYSGPEIRSSLRYSLSPSLSIKASYNNTFQYIHTLSNNTTASPTDTWRLSNLNIKPQQANQYALGFYKNIDGNEYELSLEGYYKNSKNLLDYKVGANLLLNETIETEILQGTGKAYGVEFFT